jgi:hypothetical protein
MCFYWNIAKLKSALKKACARWNQMSDPSIEVLGRADCIKYTQGSRSIDIGSELLTGQPMLVVYSGTIKAWADGQAVTSEEKAEIIDNIRRLMHPEWGEIAID